MHLAEVDTEKVQSVPVILHEFPAPGVEKAWRGLLAAVPFPSHYTSPEFFLEPYFEGKQPFAILAMDGDRATGVLTGFHDGKHVTCGLPTRPQVQMIEDGQLAHTVAALGQGLAEESRGASMVSIYTWSETALDGLAPSGYRRKQIGSIPTLDLSLGPEQLSKQGDYSSRRCVKTAIKSGVDVVPAATEDDYRAFYDIYTQWSDSKGVAPYSYEVERRGFHEAGGNRRLFLAKHSGKVIAGSVIRFAPGGLVEYSRNSSYPDYQAMKPNDLLMWRAIEWACQQGFPRWSMGGSHRFLRKFSNQSSAVIRYRLDRTVFRRHDRREQLMDFGGSLVRRMPPKVEAFVRKLLRKEIQPGW